jgi:streptogramin lyase
MRLLFLAPLVALLAQAAFAGTVEYLGSPCRAKQILAGRTVTDRATGREWFVLTNMNELSGLELLFIDFERDSGKAFRAPAGQGSWCVIEVPGDRLVTSTYYDGQFVIFDLKKMAFIKTVGFPGESYIWNMAIGSDGRVYGGTYGHGKLGALDLNTYTVEDLGAPAPPNMYLRTVSATPDGRILCSFGIEKPTTLLYDPATKRFDPVPKTIEGVGDGISWRGYFLAGSSAFKGKSFDVVAPPPFPVPPADKGGWWVDSELTSEDALYLRQGSAVYRYAAGSNNLALVADIDLRSGMYRAASKAGELLGTRGQDYFVVKPGDKTLTLLPIPVESAPRRTLFLRADDRGRLWGGPTFGQTLWWMDVRTKKAVNTGAICDAGGEVYDATFLNGKVYAASYAGGDITEYDPDQPWDQWNHKNPKPLARVGPKYIRPVGGIVTGPDGKLYSGWMAQYGTYGGAVAITDPATGDTRVIENPLGEQAVEGLATDGRFAYVGTSLSANGLAPKTGESAQFGVLDLATGKVAFRRTFQGASAVRACTYDAKTKLVAMIVYAKAPVLRLFDPAARRFVRGPAGDLRNVTSHSMAATGDGMLYYGHEEQVVALDLQTAKAAVIAEAPSGVSEVTVSPQGEVYVSCGAEVYRVRM